MIDEPGAVEPRDLFVNALTDDGVRALLIADRAAHPPALRKPAAWSALRPAERPLVGGLVLAVRADHPTAGAFELSTRFMERLRGLSETAGPRRDGWAALLRRFGQDPDLNGGALLGICQRFLDRERHLALASSRTDEVEPRW